MTTHGDCRRRRRTDLRPVDEGHGRAAPHPWLATLWLAALWLAATAASAFAQGASATRIHADPSKGGQAASPGISSMRQLPPGYVPGSAELRALMEEGGIIIPTSTAASQQQGRSTPATAAIDRPDAPTFSPEDFGIKAGADGLAFIAHRCTNVRAGTLKPILESFLSGDGAVDASPESDVIFVRDTPAALVDIKRILDHVDRPQAQVLVEAQMIELRLDKDFEKDLGLWVQRNGRISAGLLNVFGVPGDNPLIGNLSDQAVTAGEGGGVDRSLWTVARTGSRAQFGATMRFLEERGRARMLSNPKLIVRRGFKGAFLAGKEVPYYVYADEGTGSRSYAVEFKRVGIKLDVEPSMITCDTVRLVVVPEVSAIDSYTDPGRGDNQYPVQPITTVRNVSTEIEIKDGETIAIGGLFNATDQKIVRRTPGLGSVPILKHFFKADRNIEVREQLVIFLTIKIIAPGEPGGFVYPPSREIPIREMHDFNTHMAPSVLGGEMEHKWKNPEHILPPRRVEVEYGPDGRIKWNNPHASMKWTFGVTPCPYVPLADPDDFRDAEPPQSIRETWTKPGWPDGTFELPPRPVAHRCGGRYCGQIPCAVPAARPGPDGHACGQVPCGQEPCATVAAREPVDHYCGEKYCGHNPCVHQPALRRVMRMCADECGQTPCVQTVPHTCGTEDFCGRSPCAGPAAAMAGVAPAAGADGAPGAEGPDPVVTFGAMPFIAEPIVGAPVVSSSPEEAGVPMAAAVPAMAAACPPTVPWPSSPAVPVILDGPAVTEGDDGYAPYPRRTALPCATPDRGQTLFYPPAQKANAAVAEGEGAAKPKAAWELADTPAIDWTAPSRPDFGPAVDRGAAIARLATTLAPGTAATAACSCGRTH